MNTYTFRTPIIVDKAPFEINHRSNMLFIGSCFSENIGLKLKNLKFKVDLNPFGIIFNPTSIALCLNRIIDQKFFSENDLIQHNEVWHSILHHSQFSAMSKNEALEKINRRLQESIYSLTHAEFLFLTFGTAYVYYYKPMGQIVSNCHKIPGHNFEKKMLTVSEIVDNYRTVITSIKTINPSIQVIFTVSPVRHLSDGAVANSRSKARLLLAIEQLCNEGYGYYFPAYEILIDDLRDYRFYTNDFVHPSELAINYIFDIFANTFFSVDTIEYNHAIEEILKAVQHRIEYPQHSSVQAFKNQILQKIERLTLQFPDLNFDNEIQYLLSL